METSCQICGKPLTNDVSVMRGIGPICRAKQWASKTHQGAKICDYDVELFNDEKICIIREINNLKSPTISLTNCIETVLSRVIEEYNLCGDEWDFVEHANHPNLMGGYDEYDLVSLDNGSIKWRYLWHSDAKGEEHEFSRDLLVTRVNHYRFGYEQAGITSDTLSAYTNDKAKLTGLIKHYSPAYLQPLLWAGDLTELK